MDRNAFSAPKRNRSGLSSAEFRRNLYNWFENRGLLDELRAHLRQQMVIALRDTSLRPGPSRCLKSNMSPTIQAINLLVAEFLLQQDHHYTLSVFTSEVPLLRNMPEFIVSGSQISAGSNTTDESMPCFHHQDIKDIMEILGLSLDTEVGNRIYCQYEDNSKNTALLTCLLQNIPLVLDGRPLSGENKMFPGPSGASATQDRKSNVNFKDTESSNKESNSAKHLAELYNAEMQEVLYQSQLKSQHIKQLQEEIRRFQDIEVQRVRKEEEAKYKKELKDRESQIQADICRREEEITRKLNDAKVKLSRQRQSLDYDLQMKQKQLSELAIQLQEQRLEVTHKLQEVEERAEELKHQERMIEETKQSEALLLVERNSELDIRQQQLHQEFERLNAERETMSRMQRELEENRLQLVEASQSLAHSQSQASFLHELQQQCAQLRLELDATRLKLNNLTELWSQKSSHSEVPPHHQFSVEKVDKSLQTVLPVPADDIATTVQKGVSELEVAPCHLQQHQYLTDLLCQVQKENQELQGHAQQQRLRIDELTSHAAQLANQLEDAHTIITLLSNHQTRESAPLDSHPLFIPSRSGTITVPPIIASSPPQLPLPPHSHHASRVVHSHQVDAGEEINHIPSPPISQPITPSFPASSQHSSLYHRRERHKKPPRRLIVHNNTTSSDETSPTEEVLQEARRRLHRLEKESEAVDRSYRDFQRRHYESLGGTASSLFYPIMWSTHFQQQSSNLGHGSFTPSQPFFSSATGGSENIRTPFIFRNTNNNDAPLLTQHTGMLFNPVFPYNTSAFISPLFRNERIPPFQYTVDGRTPNKFAFSQELQTPGTVDNTATITSDRITTHSQSCGTGSEFTASNRYVTSTAVPQRDSTLTLQSQPPTSTDLLSTGVYKQKDKTDFINRRSNLSHNKLLDTNNYVSVDPHCHNQYCVKNVSFGSSLKTITIYNSPQVSSSTESAANQKHSQRQLEDGVIRDVCFKAADHAAASQKTNKITSTTRSVSVTQSLSRSDSWSEDFVIRENNKLPSGSSASSAQDDDWISVQFQKKNSSRDIHDFNGKSNLRSRVSDDNIWKLQRKSSSNHSSSLGPEFIPKGTKSTDKDTANKTSLKENQSIDHTEIHLKKLDPVSDVLKSHTSVLDALPNHETGSFLSSRTITTGSLSIETDLQPVLSVSNVSSTTFPSDKKDPSFKGESNNEESFVPAINLGNMETSNKQVFSSSAGVAPVQPDVLSEISGSCTQTTVQKKEVMTVKNSNTIIPSDQDVRENVAKDNEIDKDDKHVSGQVLVGVESSCRDPSSVVAQEAVDESRHFGRTNNQGGTQGLVEELSKHILEGCQSHGSASTSEEADNGKGQKFISSLKEASDASAESVVDVSDQAISVGEESKRDDSSKDDFW